MDDISKYKDLFFEESDEYIQTLNSCLLELEKNPEDKEVLEEIFRAAHTLKGMAATMGYKEMTELTHHMEDVFSLLKNGSVIADSDIISLLFNCLDKLYEMVEDLKNDKIVEYNIDELINKLENIGKEEKPVKTMNKKTDISFNLDDSDMKVISDAYSQGFNSYRINITLDKDCLLKGARAYLVVNKLEKQGEIINSNPSPESLEAGEFDFEFSLIYISKLDKESIIEIIEEISEIDNIDVQEIEQKSNIDEKDKEIPEKKEEKNVTSKTTVSQSIRVDLNRLDHFMNLVSELVIYRTRLEDINSKIMSEEIKSPLEQVARITSELQDLVLKIRMQPVSVVFNRFPRMMRDLSKELGKEFDLVISGEETELDRTVVSQLGEPLVHILRNAADHGIESIEERRLLGKPEKGTIKLTAYQEGNKVVISVSDDGKGIKPEYMDKIFQQGFSTVGRVTNISGRGVGMDVVKQKINSLGGTIDVTSKVNLGTTFVIKLPLTLSIMQALLFKVGKETFALPLLIIDSVVEVKPEEIKSTHDSEVYIYRGQAIPVVRLDRKLSLESLSSNKHLIIVLLGTSYYGLLIDELIGQQEIVIKKLEGILKNINEYLGATILGNGDIILILDAGNLCGEGKIDYIEN